MRAYSYQYHLLLLSLPPTVPFTWRVRSASFVRPNPSSLLRSASTESDVTKNVNGDSNNRLDTGASIDAVNGGGRPKRNIGGLRRRCVDYPRFALENSSIVDKNGRVNVPASTAEASYGWLMNEATRLKLLKDRSYARLDPFLTDNINRPPSLVDLSPPPEAYSDRFFISTPASIISFSVGYLIFPYLIQVMEGIIKISGSQLDEILSTYAPGVSILYGTFVSLTLSVLYNRQRTIQDNVAIETSLLTIITRSLLNLFRNDECKLIEAGQCAADQIRTLVKTSRGEELMLVMYNDPYARMMELVDLYEIEDSPTRSELVSFARSTLCELTRVRSKRLSDESLALPPTHFLILNSLTLLILMSYAISAVASMNGEGVSNTSALLFGSLTSIYTLFFNFCQDVNNPFQGVYQIRRSCAASHLMGIKWVIANHPLLKDYVDFEEVKEEDGAVQIRSPNVGDFFFDRGDIYFVDETQQTSAEDR